MKATHDFDHLWNELPMVDKDKLMPHCIEEHKLHLIQCREIAIKAHERHLKELDDWISNLEKRLKKEREQLNCGGPLGCEGRQYDYQKEDCKKCADEHNGNEYQ